MDIKKEVVNTFNTVKENAIDAYRICKKKFKNLNDDYKNKLELDEAFDENSLEFKIKGQKGTFGKQITVKMITDFKLLNKNAYIRVDDETLKFLKVGTILETHEGNFEVKEVVSERVIYYDLNKQPKENLVAMEELAFPCYKVMLKKIK